MSERISIGGVEVVVRRSERRRTVGLTVERDGSVVAAAPAGTALEEVSRLLRLREVWIHTALAQRAAMTADAPTKEYVTGEGFLYLGRHYRLRVIQAGAQADAIPELLLCHGRFHLRSDCANRGRESFIRWYSRHAQAWISARLQPLQRRVGVEANQVAVMDLGYRWASCSEGGRLNFHWRVILLPPELVTYLVLHELCHLLEHNHSDRFWSLVRRVEHDFERKERWLRENGARYRL